MENSVTKVDLSSFRSQINARLSRLPKTQPYGNRTFPSLECYREAADKTAKEFNLGFPHVAACAQLDWHLRGQNGCQFARLAASNAELLGWDLFVVADHLDTRGTQQIDVKIRACISDPRVQLVSLIWPYLQEPLSAVRVVRGLVAGSEFWLERDELVDRLRYLALRYPITKQVQAWAMAFGPFGFLPNTRRAPFFEIIIRVKEKEETIFHRLNQDRESAHLADVPLKMSDLLREHRWNGTMRRTRMILSREPDDISAAKSTITLPADYEID
ncbi:hypothetical protein [Streptomyces sp. NPDC060022]|uniref:hypothetical protein n=1 Tax=Streptomyces sp. NPDC060022 TaxID=3347039 RepID=UPI0036AEDE4C